MISYIEEKYQFISGLSGQLKALLLSSFLVALGSFMVTPFLGIYLKQTIQMDVKYIGALMAIATFVQFAGGYVGGIVAERFSYKSTMVFALSFRTIGFILLALASVVHAIIFPAVLLVAAGSAVYMPANKAYLVSSVTSELRPLFVSLSNAVLNAGMALGPLVAAAFISNNPAMLFLGIAVLFIIITVIHQINLTQLPRTQKSQIKFSQIFHYIGKVKRPFFFNTLTFYIYFFFQNFMGLYTTKMESVDLFAKVMLVNFVLMFILQLQLSKWIARISYQKILIASFALLGLGMAVMAQGSAIGIILGTAIMTTGQAFLFLRGDLEIVASLPEQPAMAFGIQRLSAGVGGLISGVIGGFLFEHYVLTDIRSFWINIALQCGLGIILSLKFGRSLLNSKLN